MQPLDTLLFNKGTRVPWYLGTINKYLIINKLAITRSYCYLLHNLYYVKL